MIACAQTPAASAPKLETDDQKTLYALGLLLGGNIKTFALTPEELNIVKAGLSDAATNAKPQVETYGPKVNELAAKRAAVASEGEKKKGQEFADRVAAEKGAKKLPDGVIGM
jgi:FKBP-type peptidyl-prolyl cis-trans isomerase FkpA